MSKNKQHLSSDLISFQYEGKEYFYSKKRHAIFLSLQDEKRALIPEYSFQRRIAIDSMWLNLTDSCNLSCRYCFIPPSDESHKSSQNHMMTKNVAQAAVILLGKLCKKYKSPRKAHITFFGGEPLLNYKVLEHTAYFAVEWTKVSSVPFTFLISINGTILNRRIVSFLLHEGFYIQLSIDGPQEMHDINRKYKSGEGSFKKIIQNLCLLHQVPKHKINIRSTISQGAVPISTNIRFLKRLGFNKIQFKFISDNNNTNAGLTDLELNRLHRDSDDAARTLFQVSKEGVVVQPFAEQLDSLKKQNWRIHICGAGNRAISIDPNGWIYPCHRFHGNSNYRIGHVTEEFDERISRQFSELDVDTIPSCGSCWATKFCWGCCPAESIACKKPVGSPNKTWCKVKKLEALISLKYAVAAGVVKGL